MAKRKDIPHDEIHFVNSGEGKKDLWGLAFGLQKVDGLIPSNFLVDLSEEEISFDEMKEKIERYYADEGEDSDKTLEEADKVSIRIVEWLSVPRPFEMSTRRLKQIHAYLFSGIESFSQFPVGKFRDVNISKPEPVLNGRSVFYELYNMVEPALQIDFSEEEKKNYDLLSIEEKAKSAMAFISNVWQIHPFS